MVMVIFGSGLGLSAANAASEASPSGPVRCERDRALRTGPTGGAFYATVAPFEHFGSGRTQVFPATCSLRELTGSARPAITSRRAPGDYSTPYIAATRDRGELFVYGYRPDAVTEGAYVARVDTRNLRETWRTPILDRSPAEGWSYPGVMLSHGNGFLYAIYGNAVVKLDPRTGRTLARTELPEDPAQTGAAYNGMIVMPDGRIVAKKIERGPCPVRIGPTAPTGAIAGLTCASANALPSVMVVLDPRRLRIVSRLVPPEPLTGRITAGRLDGRDYIYGAGTDSLIRFRYREGRLRLDREWGPVPYRTGAGKPGTGPGIMGGFVVVQTNFIASEEPLTVTAVSVRNPDRVFRIRPFPDSAESWIVSKPAVDRAKMTVVTHDTAAGRMAALKLDPRRGFRLKWTREITSLAFSALVGPARDRQVVIPDQGGDGDEVVWLSERTGAELARSAPLAGSPAPGNIVTPGFGGRFYYLSFDGRLWELRPER